MKSVWVAGFLLLQLCLSSQALGLSKISNDMTDEEVDLLYGLFKDVDRFGLISLALVGDAERIGLSEFQLTNYLDERFGYYFCNVKYEDLTQNPSKLAAAIGLRDPKIGIMTFRVWVVGEDYPLAYHVRADAGSFENPSMWSEEVLGHGSKRTVPAAIKEILNELMKQFAGVFLKVKGEHCNR